MPYRPSNPGLLLDAETSTLLCMKRRLLQLLQKAGRLFPPVLREESGQDLVEYSLLVLLIGTATVAAVDRFGDILYYTFYKITIWLTHAGHNYKFR